MKKDHWSLAFRWNPRTIDPEAHVSFSSNVRHSPKTFKKFKIFQSKDIQSIDDRKQCSSTNAGVEISDIFPVNVDIWKSIRCDTNFHSSKPCGLAMFPVLVTKYLSLKSTNKQKHFLFKTT